jgi:hypothetical protein
MGKYIVVNFLVRLRLASAYGPQQEQKFEYTKQAELDADGNVYVSSRWRQAHKDGCRWALYGSKVCSRQTDRRM